MECVLCATEMGVWQYYVHSSFLRYVGDANTTAGITIPLLKGKWQYFVHW
jgi:hypothetical protein